MDEEQQPVPEDIEKIFAKFDEITKDTTNAPKLTFEEVERYLTWSNNMALEPGRDSWIRYVMNGLNSGDDLCLYK